MFKAMLSSRVRASGPRAAGPRLGIRTGFFSLCFSLLFLLSPGEIFACNGKDVILSENPSLSASDSHRTEKGAVYYFDDQGNMLVEKSRVKISPSRAWEIAERFVRQQFPDPPLPLTFRKMEWVHNTLIYQFESEPLSDFNGLYHLGPVNFTVDRLVLDVDAATGTLSLANGCGAAPGKQLAPYDPKDFEPGIPGKTVSLVSNNTNFIARKTGNLITVDGRIDPEEWRDTGHRYFYLGEYSPHAPSQPHAKASYYAEVWAQIDDEKIYFAVKTDTPTWVALMFKNDPNLGMLGAYRDGKVLKSDGGITDRHFVQRPDQTFFLEVDTQDDILARGSGQGDFYTYELAFPLKSGDATDVQFEAGKAYNMLFFAGNTLEHHGIFTMDKAHANHDHSKNNKEHVDVWSSTEVTLRIGDPADRDIFGNRVRPALAGFNSGFDPSKNATHLHFFKQALKDFSARPMATFVVGISAVVLGLAALLFIFWRLSLSRRNTGPHTDPEGIDLLKYARVRRFVTWKYFRAVFIAPVFLVFLAVIVLGILDVQDGRKNIATIYTWTLWWSIIIFSFILFGRLWCMMCPFQALGDLAQRLVSLNRKLPRFLNNMGFQVLAFVLLTLAYTLLSFESKPFVTAVVILSILLAAVVSSVIFTRRSFCRHLCPIGAVLGLYSTLSPFKLAPADKACCDGHQRKTCTEACPMLESPQEKHSSVYCNLCMKCLPACPNDNLTLRLRPLGSDLYAAGKRPLSEALASLFLLGVIIVETLAMTSAWEPLKSSLGGWLGWGSRGMSYLAVFIVVVVLPVGVYYLICTLLRMWLGEKGYRTSNFVTRFAFVFIPLGISLHLAHNLQHLFIESPVAVPATVRLLNQLGMSLDMNWNTTPLLGSIPLFLMQMGILVAGLLFTMTILYRILRRSRIPLGHLYKTTTAMAFYAIIVMVSSIYLLGLPMSGRHIH